VEVSSDTATGPASDIVVSQGLKPAGLTATYDSVTNTITVTDGMTDYVYSDTNPYDNGSVVSYRRTSTASWDDFSVYGETTSGSGNVLLINSTEPGIQTRYVEVTRVGETEVPTSGSTSYAGDYGAWLFQTSGTEPIAWDFVSGDATLTADFGNVSTISGSVINRVGLIYSYEDLTFELATITNGGFSGVVSGGERLGGDTTTDGEYVGLLTGADGGEVVGSTLFDHSFDRTEVGVFITEEVIP
jgi:hypothetical protein